VESERACTQCHRLLPASDFEVIDVRVRQDGTRQPSYRSECRDCKSAAQTDRRNRASARTTEAQRRADRRRRALRFGLTLDEYDALWARMLLEQNGLCAVCRLVPPVALDHDHATLELRGLLCVKCNLAAGLRQGRPGCGLATERIPHERR